LSENAQCPSPVAKNWAIKKMADDLSQVADDFPALARSSARILANIKMTELNVSDLWQIGGPEIDT
jgi:hypothetical protein